VVSGFLSEWLEREVAEREQSGSGNSDTIGLSDGATECPLQLCSHALVIGGRHIRVNV